MRRRRYSANAPVRDTDDVRWTLLGSRLMISCRFTFAVGMAAASYLALSLISPQGQALAQSSNLPPVTVASSQAASRFSFKQHFPTVSELGSFETNATRCRSGFNDKCTTNTRSTKFPARTRPARRHQWLCGGTHANRHQDQHADHGDAASDFESSGRRKFGTRTRITLAAALRYAPGVRGRNVRRRYAQ